MFTGTDLTIVDLDEARATICLEARNVKQMDRFLENAPLIRFLQDSFDMNGNIRGCRLHIRADRKSKKLHFQRDMKKTTFPSIAYLDLVHSLCHFVWRDISLEDEMDLLRGHEAQKKLLWERAIPFSHGAKTEIDV